MAPSEPDQFSGLHEQIDAQQVAIDKVDSPAKADGTIQGHENYARIFINEVDAVQAFLLTNDNDIANEEQYLQTILDILNRSLNPQVMDNMSNSLHTHLDEIYKKTQESTTTPEGTTEATEAGIPEKPTLAETTLTLKSSDTLTGIVASKFGVDWKQTPNAAFVLVHALNDKRDKDKQGNPDALVDDETIDVDSILQDWDSLPWHEDALAWYQGASKASQKDSWVSGLRRRSKEKEEKKPEIAPLEVVNLEIIQLEEALSSNLLEQISSPADSNPNRSNYRIVNPNLYEWNGATGLEIKRIKFEAPKESTEGVVAGTIMDIDNPNYTQYVTVLDTAQNNSEDTKEDYRINDETQWEWASKDPDDISIRKKSSTISRTAGAYEGANEVAGVPRQAVDVTINGQLTSVPFSRMTEATQTQLKALTPDQLVRLNTILSQRLNGIEPYTSTDDVDVSIDQTTLRVKTGYNTSALILTTAEMMTLSTDLALSKDTLLDTVHALCIEYQGFDENITFPANSPTSTLRYSEVPTVRREALDEIAKNTDKVAALSELISDSLSQVEGKKETSELFYIEGDSIWFDIAGTTNNEHILDDSGLQEAVEGSLTLAEYKSILTTIYKKQKAPTTTTNDQPQPAEAEPLQKKSRLDVYVNGQSMSKNFTSFSEPLKTALSNLTPQDLAIVERLIGTATVPGYYNSSEPFAVKDATLYTTGYQPRNVLSLDSLPGSITGDQFAELVNSLWKESVGDTENITIGGVEMSYYQLNREYIDTEEIRKLATNAEALVRFNALLEKSMTKVSGLESGNRNDPFYLGSSNTEIWFDINWDPDNKIIMEEDDLQKAVGDTVSINTTSKILNLLWKKTH